ncbi:hypothetical protein K492DRAFT_12938 [Lichtheimia hyalospora FSU 10163]|nr:hypothetical protein K492DRAFT_12938 [Lichtheimia hyalospora FSU 10163]
MREQEKRAAKAAKKMRKGVKDADDFQLLSTADDDMYDDTRPLKTAAAEPYRGDVKLEIAPPPEPVYEPASYYNNYSSPSFHHQQPHSYYNEEPYYEMQQYPPSSPYQPHRQWPTSPAPPTPAMSSPYTASTTLAPSTPYSYTTTTISSPSPGYRAAGPVHHPNNNPNNYF